MARKSTLQKRRFLFEMLERRSVMAGDLMICPMPELFDGESTGIIYSLDAVDQDNFPAQVNAAITRVGEEAPGVQMDFVRDLQASLGNPDFYGNQSALDALTEKYLQLGQSTSTENTPATSGPDPFLTQVNDALALVREENPAGQADFVIALQNAMADVGSTAFYGDEVALFELTNDHLNTYRADQSDTRPVVVIGTSGNDGRSDAVPVENLTSTKGGSEGWTTTSIPSIEHFPLDFDFQQWVVERQMHTRIFNQHFEVGLTYSTKLDRLGSEVWYRANDQERWVELDTPELPASISAINLDGDNLIVRSWIYSDDPNSKFNETEITVDLVTAKLFSSDRSRKSLTLETIPAASPGT